MSSSSPEHQVNFLVTCVGAYDDSGIGTGGFVVVHEGRSTVIDKIDSTGLCHIDGVYYRFARGMRSIVGYREDGVNFVLKIPEARDIHDILWSNGQFVAVSTGSNEVLWVDPLGKIQRRWRGDGERDAWHLNCLCEVDGRLHVAAFGRFAEHRGWVGKCQESGFVLDLESGREVVTGLNGPHNPRFVDGEWIICDSHASALVFQRGNELPRSVKLGGFTRGLDVDEHFLYVGESANRKAEIPSNHSSIAVVDRKTHGVVTRISVPFPEIYEVVAIPATLAARISAAPGDYQINQGDERSAQLERQVEIGWKEIELLKRRLEPLLTVENLRGRLVNLKRRLVG